MQSSCVPRKETVRDLFEPSVSSLFQVVYGHFHVALRSRMLGLKHNLLCTGQSVALHYGQPSLKRMLITRKGPKEIYQCDERQTKVRDEELNRLRILGTDKNRKISMQKRHWIEYMRLILKL